MGQIAGEKTDGLSPADRAANAEKYAADMRAHADAQLERDRGRLVAAFRKSPGSWPGGVDTRFDRWFRSEEWNDAGEYIGVRPCVRPLNHDPETPVGAAKVEATAAAPNDNRKPWEIAGMSRSSWERRKKAEKGSSK